MLKEKLDEEVARHKTWLMSGENLASLLYGSQSVNSGIGCWIVLSSSRIVLQITLITRSGI